MPTLTARSITGTVADALGDPYQNKVLYFKPLSVFGASGTVVNTGSISALTDDEGAFSVDLYTVDIEGAFVRYRCELPDDVSLEFDLEAGSATTLDVLIDQTALTESPLPAAQAAMQVIVDAALEDYEREDVDLGAIAVINSATANVIASIGAGWVGKTWAQVKTLMTFVKADVGLSNVDNTADSAKPVSTAQAAADAAVLASAIQRSNHSGTQSADTIVDGTTNKVLSAANKTKLDNISVTQAVDLDDIESRVNNLDAAVVLKGVWDASVGTFPGSGTAQAGASYIVSVAGTVGGVAFNIGDRAIAITDNASTTVFASNWFKADYTDQVLSVNGQTGAVTLSTSDVAEGTNQYFTAARVRDVVLTGISLVTNQAIQATDTVLQALGYLQKQITDLIATVGGKQDTLVSATNIKTVNGSSLLGSGDLVVSGGVDGITGDGTDLLLDTPGGTTTIGDVGGAVNNTQIVVDDVGGIISVSASNGFNVNGSTVVRNDVEAPVSLDSPDGPKFRLTEYASFGFNTAKVFSDNPNVISLGDGEANGNGTKVSVDDDAQTIDLQAANGVTVNGSPIGGAAFITPVSGGSHVLADADIGKLYLNPIALDLGGVSVGFYCYVVVEGGGATIDAGSGSAIEPAPDGQVATASGPTASMFIRTSATRIFYIGEAGKWTE